MTDNIQQPLEFAGKMFIDVYIYNYLYIYAPHSTYTYTYIYITCIICIYQTVNIFGMMTNTSSVHF